MTDQELAQLVMLICSSWRTMGELDDADRIVARRQLSELDFAAATSAVDLLAREKPEWFPGWGAVAAKAIELTNPVDDEALALAEVQQAFASIGRYGIPVWSTPAIAETVRALGGWVRCCDMAAEHFPRQFNQLYSRCAGRARQQALLPASARHLLDGLRLKEVGEGLAPVASLPYATRGTSNPQGVEDD